MNEINKLEDDKMIKTYQYATGCSIEAKYFDIQLMFRTSVDDIIVEETSIIVSPQHLKVLNYMIEDTIKNYENEFGEIPISKLIEEQDPIKESVEE